jgi:hypothetical protein
MPKVGEVWATQRGHTTHRISEEWSVYSVAACGSLLMDYDRRTEDEAPSCRACLAAEEGR